MATTQPVLETNNLPYPTAPDGYKEEYLYRGASIEMADGTVKWDLTNATAKHVFTLQWAGLNTTEKGAIETAYAAIKTAYNASNFTSPNGSTYTVVRHPSQNSLKWESTIIAGNTLRYATTMVLQEV